MWNNCLSKLENELPAQEFNTWIRPLQAIETNNQIKLLAPNQFVLDWVKEHFFSKIKSTINDFSNSEIQLILTIGSKSTVTSSNHSEIKTHNKTKKTNT